MLAKPLEFATVEQAWEALYEQVGPGPHREVPVEESHGRVLAADVCAGHDFPPFDRAMMDGYAVRAADLADGAATLRVTELVRAGFEGREALEPGTCQRINTGAPIPAGADAVVMVERSREAGEGCVRLEDQPREGQHIERRGHQRRAGELLVRAGTRADPGTLAALIAGGAARVRVFERPRVALLSTGDELVPAGTPLGPGQIHDSNRAGIERWIERSGGEPVCLGTCPDEPAALRAKLAGGLEHDVLCVIGGMSKGTHDFVPATLEQLGVEWLVRTLNVKPGKPARIGRKPGGAWVIGLPGNPVSASVCLLLLGRTILTGLQGLGAKPPPRMRGRLEGELPPTGDRPMFQPGTWLADVHGEVVVAPTVWRGSGDPFGMVGANALIQRPARAAATPRGDSVYFFPIDLPT